MQTSALLGRPRLSRTMLAVLLSTLFTLLTVAAAQDQEQPAAPDIAAPQATLEPTPASVDPDPIVVRVGERVERLSDIEWRFEIAVRSFAAGQGLSYNEEIAAQMRPMLPTYLEQRGTELVLLREAERRGLEPNEENVNEYLEGIRGSVQEGENYEEMLAAAGFGSEEHLVTLIEEGDVISQVIAAFNEEAAPSDDELRVRYLAEIGRYTTPEQYCARHILVDDEALARDIVDRVAGGEDFAQLAAEFGTDGTASSGGDLGCFGRGAMVAEFENAVVDAEVGTVSGPVQTQFGYHALLVYDHSEPSITPFEDVKEELREGVAAATGNARLSGLIRGAAIITYPELVPGL